MCTNKQKSYEQSKIKKICFWYIRLTKTKSVMIVYFLWAYNNMTVIRRAKRNFSEQVSFFVIWALR